MWMRTCAAVAALTIPAAALATPASDASVAVQEGSLLNLPLDLNVLQKVRVWDQGAWRPLKTGEGVREQTPIVVMNFWATWCKPCMEELPWLWELARREEGKGDVKFVFLSTSSGQVKGYFDKNARLLPHGLQYEDTADQVLQPLRARVPERARGAGLPVTLVLDEERVIRKAFVGDLLARKGEMEATLTLLRQGVKRHSGGEAVVPGEMALLHRRIDQAALQPLVTAGEKPPLMVYLFAEDTPSWREDLPWLRDQASRLEGGDARLAVVEEGQGSEDELRRAGGALYQDVASAIGQSLRVGLPGGRLPLPLLLFLDEDRVVRQAFVGGLADRRDAVVDTVERLRQIRRR